MLMLCFTYLQVMPEFIDFLLIFGKQSRAQLFQFGAFRQRTRLFTSGFQSLPGLKIPALGWSGRDLQLCYNLKSMEPSSQGGWPWSARDCAINHTFDIDSIRIIWIMIKGDALIQDRIRSATKNQSPAELSSFQSLDRAFASTLATHLIIIVWATENWEQFISFVEGEYHEISRRAVSNEIEIPPILVRDGASGSLPIPRRTSTEKSGKSIFSISSHARNKNFDSLSSFTKKDMASPMQQVINPEIGLKHNIIPTAKGAMRVEFDTRGQQAFSFGDLQALQNLDDKAKEAILILRLNMKIMLQLVQYYETTMRSTHFPKPVSRNCHDEFDSFQSRIEGLRDDLQTYILKLETLVEYIASCKTLVSRRSMSVRT